MRILDKKWRTTPCEARLAFAGVLSSLALTGVGARLFCLNLAPKLMAVMPSGSHPDFSGHWKLDKAKSTLPSPSPDDLVEVIEHRDPRLRITTTSKDWSGDFWLNTQKPIALTLFALTIPEWVATTDGVERNEKYGPAELKSKTHWEGDQLITAWSLERDGRPEITGEWVRSLSADGKTQSLGVKAHDPQRSAQGEASLVFVKSDEDKSNTASSRGNTVRTELSKPDNDVRRPVPIRKPEPQYTEKARDEKIQGTVVLWMIVDAHGDVTDARVVKNLHPDLDRSAVDAVRTWKFHPATRNGVPVAVRLRVEIYFKLF